VSPGAATPGPYLARADTGPAAALPAVNAVPVNAVLVNAVSASRG
jgi:hypothetical protein